MTAELTALQLANGKGFGVGDQRRSHGLKVKRTETLGTERREAEGRVVKSLPRSLPCALR